MRTLHAQSRGYGEIWLFVWPSELNFDDFNVFFCKKYYSQTVRVLVDQVHVYISRADG